MAIVADSELATMTKVLTASPSRITLEVAIPKAWLRSSIRHTRRTRGADDVASPAGCSES